MEAGFRKTSSRVCLQDSRLRFYGGTIYGSVHWVPVDPGVDPHHPEDDHQVEGLETAVDRLSCLPDHVIVHHVFDKMPDLKTLFNFSLVSKHFASLVLDAQAVSVKVANWLPVCSCHPDPTARPPTFLSRAREHIIDLLKKPFRSTSPLLTRHDRDNFLNKFSCVRSLDIDLSYTGTTTSSPTRDHPFLRWRFDKYGFILVSAENREVGVDGEDATVTVDDEEAAVDVWKSIEYHLLDAVYRLRVATLLLNDIRHLKNISVRDCLRQGRVEVDKEVIGEYGRAGDVHESEPWCVKVWHLRAVKLPLMGCVMKGVTLCVVKEDGIEDGLLVENAFGEDLDRDREYGELARRVVNEKVNRSGKIWIGI